MRPTLIRTVILLAIGIGVSLLGDSAGIAQEGSSGTASEVKRRLDYWRNGPDADILFQGVPADPAATTTLTTGPKAVALCVGINTVDPRHYSADPRQPVEIAPPLWGAVDDARLVARGFRWSGFDVTLLTDERATTGAVTKFLTDQAAARTAGDLVVVYFAGYGARLLDRSWRQRDSVCLYDRMLLEEEVFRALAQFKAPGPEVVLVLDCGTGTAAPKDVFNVTQTIVKTNTEQLAERLSWALKRFREPVDYAKVLRDYTDHNQLKWPHGQPDRWANVRVRHLDSQEATNLYWVSAAYRPTETGPPVQPGLNVRVTRLSAGEDNTPALEINGAGVYTASFVDAYFGPEVARRLLAGGPHTGPAFPGHVGGPLPGPFAGRPAVYRSFVDVHNRIRQQITGQKPGYAEFGVRSPWQSWQPWPFGMQPLPLGIQPWPFPFRW